VIGAYDAYLSAEVAGEAGDADASDSWNDPEVVLRLGASPTSKRLRKYLAETGADQYQVDPAGRWREAEFAATDLVVAEPSRSARSPVPARCWRRRRRRRLTGARAVGGR